MNIQSNINQTLSIAGLLLAQIPKAATQKEKALESMRTKEAYKRYNKALVAEEEAAEQIPKGDDEAAFKVYETAAETAVEQAETLFAQDPNPETAKQLRLSYEGLGEYKQSAEEAAREKARKAVIAEQNRLARARVLEGVYSPLTDIRKEVK